MDVPNHGGSYNHPERWDGWLALLLDASDYVSWFTSPTVGLALGATILAGVSPERRDVVRPRHVGVAVRAGTAPR